MTTNNQSLPPLPNKRTSCGIEFVMMSECKDYGDARAAHARKVALEEATALCRNSQTNHGHRKGGSDTGDSARRNCAALIEELK